MLTTIAHSMNTKFLRLFLSLATFAAVSSFAASHTETTKVPRLPFLRGMGFDGYYEQRNRPFMTNPGIYIGLAEKGFDHIRLPVDFRDYSIYDDSTGVATLLETTISRSWLGPSSGPGFSTFDTIIDHAEAAGLYIVLDFHGLNKFPVESDANARHFIAIWKAVAERYKDRSNKLVFEIWNEPHWELKAPPICAIEKAVIKEIRKTNPTRLILFDAPGGGASWMLADRWHDMVELPKNDNNIALVVHEYEPQWFSHQGETWVSGANMTPTGIDDRYCTGTNDNGVAVYSTARQKLIRDLQNCQEWVNWSDVPLVLNEFNVSRHITPHADITEYLSIVTRFCESNGIPWAPWIYYAGPRSGMNCVDGNGDLLDYIKPGLFPDLKTTDDFSASDYAHAVDITFSGYTGASALSNFPALVKLSPDIRGFSYGDFRKPGGGDLRFTDADGNLIPHEIDTWNTNGVSTAWVKVPSLTASTTITAHYGCDKPCVPKVESVWDADFVGVWHLGEKTLPLADSSNVSRDFTSADGTGIGYGAAGIVGGAVDFGETGNGRSVNADDHRELDGFRKMTIETWTYQASRAEDTGILAKRMEQGNQMSYFLHDNGSATVFTVSADGSAALSPAAALDRDLGRWNHQVHTFDATAATGNVVAYRNGGIAYMANLACESVFAGAAELHLGNLDSGGARNFPGLIDEVRISKCVRSADWIKATFETVTSANFADYHARSRP